MKRLLLLLTLLIAGMTANAQFSPSNNLNYVKLLKDPPVATKNDSVVMFDGTDKFLKMMPVSELVDNTAIYLELAKKQFLSTGLIKNGMISINGDPTKFNITAGIGIISNFDNPEIPVSTIVNFGPFTGITPTYLTSGNITYLAVNSSGVLIQQATEFTTSQRRDLILLGAVIHSNLTTINVVNNISAPTNADTNQLHDLMTYVGPLNLDGNKYAANGANLALNKSAGTIFKYGVNFATDWKKPHELSQALQTALTFRYRTQNGTEGSDRINLDPTLYDVSNVLTTVPNNKFTIQTITMFQTGLTRIQYGQNIYDDLAAAERAIFTRDFAVESNIKANGVSRAYVIMRNTTTSLQASVDAKIIEVQKYGGVASGGVALTLASIVDALGFTPENVANKATNFTTVNNTLYPSVQAVKNELDLKANLASPAFTGIPTVPTASAGTNTNQIASTAFVLANAGGGGGSGDMILASAQTNTGVKTFLDGTLGLRNVANTFTSFFTNTNTAIRTYTLQNKTGTIAQTDDYSVVPLNEGNGIGHVINGRTAANYGSVGFQAVDLSNSDGASGSRGATGYASIAGGANTTASGNSAVAFGNGNTSSGPFATVGGGFGNTASGNLSAVIGGDSNQATGAYSLVSGGSGGRATGAYSTVVGGLFNRSRSYGEICAGLFGTDYTPISTTTWQGLDRLYNLGNGTDDTIRTNALTILKNGLATLPSVTNTLISGETTGKAIVTKSWVPEQLKDFYADVNNISTTETDLLTYTTVANRLNATGEKLISNFAGTFNDVTASSQLKIYFAGQNIGDTGALTMSVTGAWVTTVSIIRTGTTTGRAVVNISTPGASTAAYTKYTSLTGLTFTGANIVKITGTAGGATGGNDDITATYGNIIWQPASL